MFVKFLVCVQSNEKIKNKKKLSFSSRNLYITSLVYSNATPCCDPSSMVHSVFSGTPKNFKFSLLEYVSIYKSCFFKS